ncbi:MAG: aldo/keto reductase [Planctomycetota bacterium]|jgi:predicted aldo/keto reductase-like oxidoreductase
MELIDFGKRSGLKVPRANIGGMRLPKDDDEAVELVRYALDRGMRYIDTCRGYGDSEIKIGKALKDGYRDKAILSSKWCPWIKMVEETDDASADCMRKRLEDSLKRLDVDVIDFYQIWNINNQENFEKATRPGGMLDGVRKAMDEGLVRHTGITTHDKVERLLEYLPELDWCEVILVSYNMLEVRYAPVIAKARELGMGTIVMNPVAGGRLVGDSPVLTELAGSVGARDVPDLALRWLLSNPALDTYISGISTKRDVDAAIAAAEAGPFEGEALEKVNDFVESHTRKSLDFCTGCDYCKPCPQEINIPAVMARIYEERFWGLREAAAERYRKIKGPHADACVACGECEAKCTQKLKIAEEMRYAAEHFGA